jgi:hypothetical protein
MKQGFLLDSSPARANPIPPGEVVARLQRRISPPTARWGALLLPFLVACGIVHMHPDADPGKLSTAEEDIRIFFKDQKLPCEHYVDLGHIQAVSGEELEPDEDQEERATFESAISWLRVEAHKRGASAVIIYSRTQNKEQTAYLVMGRAIRCPIEKDL